MKRRSRIICPFSTSFRFFAVISQAAGNSFKFGQKSVRKMSREGCLALTERVRTTMSWNHVLFEALSLSQFSRDAENIWHSSLFLNAQCKTLNNMDFFM